MDIKMNEKYRYSHEPRYSIYKMCCLYLKKSVLQQKYDLTFNYLCLEEKSNLLSCSYSIKHTNIPKFKLCHNLIFLNLLIIFSILNCSTN